VRNGGKTEAESAGSKKAGARWRMNKEGGSAVAREEKRRERGGAGRKKAGRNVHLVSVCGSYRDYRIFGYYEHNRPIILHEPLRFNTLLHSRLTILHEP
jgi:hypothetical protein